MCIINKWVFKRPQIAFAFELVQFWSSLKTSLVQVFPKLHWKPYIIIYILTPFKFLKFGLKKRKDTLGYILLRRLFLAVELNSCLLDFKVCFGRYPTRVIWCWTELVWVKLDIVRQSVNVGYSRYVSHAWPLNEGHSQMFPNVVHCQISRVISSWN
jgi:hypothetical protein